MNTDALAEVEFYNTEQQHAMCVTRAGLIHGGKRALILLNKYSNKIVCKKYNITNGI